jgi:large subunit ribosomal protein L6e
LSGVDSKKVDEVAGDKYFAREKGDKKKGEEQFFKQGEKAEVRICGLGRIGSALTTVQKKKPSSSRAADQKAVDKALLSTIKKEPLLISYLASSFSLRKGDRPHEMVW